MATCNCIGPPGNCPCMRISNSILENPWEYKPNIWDDAWKKLHCKDPSHNFPNMLYIAPGSFHTHTCPGCNRSITIYAPMVTL